jgi:hypothetical protein
MDEKRVWVLKKTGSPVDCDVLGRAAASDARDVCWRCAQYAHEVAANLHIPTYDKIASLTVSDYR